MSTIKVNKIENTGTTDGGVEIDSSGHVQVDGLQMPTAGALSSRRINVNGAMQVAQRGTVVNAGNEYGGPDRFKFVKNEGAYTISQDTDAPAGSGFSNSYKIDVTSAGNPAGSAGNVVLLEHRIEGQNLQLVKKGTSAAEKLTIQFWIKTSVTGTDSLELKDVDNSRYISKAYTVSSADTWEYKTVVFDADTTGAFDNDSNQSLVISWWLLAGSNFTSGTLSTTWTSQTAADRAVGQVNACSSTSNNIFLTGIQIEVGEKATPFEHRSFGDELAGCQRYFTRSYAYGTATGTATRDGAVISTAYSTINYASAGTAFFPVEMRSAPSVTIYSSNDGGTGEVSADSTDGGGSAGFTGTKSTFIRRANDSAGVAANVYINAHYVADAEL